MEMLMKQNKLNIGQFYCRTKKAIRNDIIRRMTNNNKYTKKLLRRLQSENNGSLKILKDIPKNDFYCYTRTNEIIGHSEFEGCEIPRYKIIRCPHWYSIPIEESDLDNHVGIVAMGQKHIGGCKLLKLTDDDMEGWGLLWDKCKECPF